MTLERKVNVKKNANTKRYLMKVLIFAMERP